MKQKRGLKPTIFLTKNRRGQFYLIAAIVIIGLVIGFAVISNYTRRRASIKLYDFGEELGIESKNVLDYGTYNEYDETAMDILLQSFVDSYSYYAVDKNLYFIFGDEDKIIIWAYQDLAEDVLIDGTLLVINGEEKTVYDPTGNKVEIKIGDIPYEFKLNKGDNFYFVVSQEIDGEKYVVTN